MLLGLLVLAIENNISIAVRSSQELEPRIGEAVHKVYRGWPFDFEPGGSRWRRSRRICWRSWARGRGSWYSFRVRAQFPDGFLLLSFLYSSPLGLVQVDATDINVATQLELRARALYVFLHGIDFLWSRMQCNLNYSSEGNNALTARYQMGNARQLNPKF